MDHPRHTTQLLGQEKAKQLLISRFKNHAIPSALLFMGPKGVGKASCAYHFAYHIFKNSIENFGQIDKTDPIFCRIMAESHGDLLVIERARDTENKQASFITVDQARSISNFLNRTAMEGGWRIVIIDSIDEMNNQAQNAILKKLEEPPPQCLFILIYHQLKSVPATIISRCQKVIFSTLKSTDLTTILMNQAIPLNEAQIQLITRIAEGSAERAFHLIQYKGDQLYQQLIDVLTALLQGEWQKAFTFTQGLFNASDNFEREKFVFIGYLIDYIIAEAVQAIVTRQPLSDLARLLSKYSLEQVTLVWQKIQTLFRDCDQFNMDFFQTMISAFGLVHDLKKT